MEAEVVFGNYVDPRMRCGFAAAEANDIFVALGGEAAITVPEFEAVAGECACFLDRLGAVARGFRWGFQNTVLEERYGAGDLLGNRPVAGMEDRAGGGEQGGPGGIVHQVAAYREDVLARAVGLATKTGVLAHGIQRVLHVLCIGACPLVDDDQIGRDAARAQIFLSTQRAPRDVQVHVIVDAQHEDREVARDRQRPERRLRCGHGFSRTGICAQQRFRIDQIAPEDLEGGCLLRGCADMAHLHLAARPRMDVFVAKCIRMAIAVNGRVDHVAVGRCDRPEDGAHLLAGRDAYHTAQRQDRVKRVAIRAGERCAGIKCGGVGERPAATDEVAAARLEFRGARFTRRISDQVRDMGARSLGVRLLRQARMTSPATTDFRAE